MKEKTKESVVLGIRSYKEDAEKIKYNDLLRFFC